MAAIDLPVSTLGGHTKSSTGRKRWFTLENSREVLSMDVRFSTRPTTFFLVYHPDRYVTTVYIEGLEDETDVYCI